jgi:hypothetical protein
MSSTPIELAVLKSKGELAAALDLTALPRAELAEICQRLAIRTRVTWAKIDYVTAILGQTHPHPAPSASSLSIDQASFL